MVAALLGGCATPTVSTLPAGPAAPAAPADAAALQARYAADLDACRKSAAQVNVVADALDGLVQGAFVTALVVWGLGGSRDAVQDWAAAGAVLGATGEGARSLARRRDVELRCMATRGHSAVLPVPAAPQPAAAVSPPSAEVPMGVDGFSAERLARTQACSAVPAARLAAKGPGFETYTVACDSGDALAIRCEFGHCRVLR